MKFQHPSRWLPSSRLPPSVTLRRSAPLLAALVAAVALAGSGEAATIYTVTSSADSGPGSLRAAITAANGHAGLDTIAFAVAGGGPVTIALQSDLIVTDPVVIDGTTQPGFAGHPLVELNGEAVAFAGPVTYDKGLLVVESGGTTVRGLVVNRSGASGIVLRYEGENVVEGNYLGTDLNGEADLGNWIAGVIAFGSAGNTIRGNLSSGNGAGVQIVRGHSNLVVGNRIGTDASGTAGVPNGFGVYVVGSANTIGGTAPGAGNLISGNRRSGIQIESWRQAGIPAVGNVVQGNLIGTNVAGSGPLPNGTMGGPGVAIERGAFGNRVGGRELGARNVISGNNLGSGVTICYDASANVVQGNLIGLDRTGSNAIGNGIDGVSVCAGSTDNTIGGSAPGEGNVISGNGRAGVFLIGVGSNRVEGNLIGTTAGQPLLPMGNHEWGVDVVAEEGGITVVGNTIAYNGWGGAEVRAGVGQSLLRNVFFANIGPAIDLITDPTTVGPTPNDPGDLDEGTNGMQNFPVLTAAAPSGKGTAIRGGLRSTFASTFRLEFFSSPACDQSGFGEARTYLGARTVTTDLFGKADFSFWSSSQVPLGHVVTATATSSTGSTSELSRCEEVDGKLVE